VGHSHWRVRFALLYAALALFFGAYSFHYFRRFSLSITAECSIYACLTMLFALALAPAFPALRSRRAPPVGVLLFLLPYLLYCAGTGDFRWPAFAKVFALAALPFVVFAARPVRHRERLNWQDAAALLWLTLPVFLGKIGGIWNVPENLDFMARVFLLGVGAWSFLTVRGLDDSGYDFRCSLGAARDSLLAFAGFGAIAVPLGFGLRFIAWNPRFHGVPDLLFDYAFLFFFIAILEEFFFRGLLQNLLEGTLGSRYGAQALASVIFGLSHIRHAPYPNWRYVALATLAGWFYGSAYRNHRSLIASSVAHAMVDTLWRTWLTR